MENVCSTQTEATNQQNNSVNQVIIEKDINGRVVKVNKLKHYSFIKRMDNPLFRDIFARDVNIINRQVQSKFLISDICKFDIIQTPRGYEAINITIEKRKFPCIKNLPKIQKVKKNHLPEVSCEFFQSTIATLFREALHSKKQK